MPKEFQQIVWGEQLEDDCRQLVRLAVREDLDRTYDWTTVALVGHAALGRASIVAREAGVVAGIPAIRVVLDEMAPSVTLDPAVEDGTAIEAGSLIAELRGPARDLLTCERIILNLLSRLSGVASLTSQYVTAVAHTAARVYDTRKTTPGWRRLEKYAVRCGGGFNHRTGLFDAVLIKDNHLALGASDRREAFSPAEAVRTARDFLYEMLPPDEASQAIVEIEVDTIKQLEPVLAAEPDIVLLDNMPPDELREAVALRNRLAPGVELEASGGVRLETIAAIAETGVERISAGALTHQARSLDIGLDWK